MNPYIVTIVMLVCSNCFMTFAWYGHLRTMGDKAWWVAALASWGIALCEYLIMVAANRIGYTVYAAATQNHSGGYHALGVRDVLRFLHAPVAQTRLSVGDALHDYAVYFMFRN